LTYTDTGLSAATTYYYKIRAVATGLASSFSNEVNQSTLPNPPAAPANLIAQSFTASQIVVAWTDNSINEVGFEIYRSTNDNTGYALLQTTAANVSTFSDNGLTASTRYFYKVRAVNTGGASSYSNEINLMTLPPPPNAPSGLQAKWGTASPLTLTLTWTDNSTTETSFEIYKSIGSNANYSLVQTTSANTISYTDNSVAAGTTYYFKVRAVNQGGNSTFTNEVVTVITGIEEFASTSFVVYPNPSSTEFAIDNNTGSDLKFNVYNSLGELILSDEISLNAKRFVNCKSWNSGVYIVQLPQLRASYKVIKE